ncbi:hypothetical protein [Geomicrobium sediminis]|uniref:Uncharacterized protein n=1 Tax=Geomicrobium sediminis TaxID=1347788 RepID=A0ABS2PED6_9BACL|nr:hypothetical protein [Geomicrobium sediminis]MBM7633773.1 hypothetical protein [Geomicrobium sediminis]
MRLKRGASLLMFGLVLFLSGVLSGHYYAYYQWGEVYHDERVVDEEVLKEKSESMEDQGMNLSERQEQLRQNDSSNFFSDLGKTLGGSPR